MEVSYSFHISGKKNSVSTINQVQQCSKHNLRRYGTTSDYDPTKIEVLRGSQTSILDDVKQIYHDEFDSSVVQYNQTKRPGRQIGDYLEHVSESRTDVAVEIIIQLGNRDYWADKSLEEKRIMNDAFDAQITSLEALCPEFKIASAVVHYDESSPHMHIIGVPVADDYQKGMAKQVAKTKVFTAQRLEELQNQMRQEMASYMAMHPDRFEGIEITKQTKGRNYDIPKQSMDAFCELNRQKKGLENAIEDLHEEEEELRQRNQVTRDAYDYIEERAQANEIPKIQINVRDGIFGLKKEISVQIPVRTEEEAEAVKKEIEALYGKNYARESFDVASEAAQRRALDVMDKARTKIENAEKILENQEMIIKEAERQRESIISLAKKQAEDLLKATKEKVRQIKEEIQGLLRTQQGISTSIRQLQDEKRALHQEIDEVKAERIELEPLHKEMEELKREYDILTDQLNQKYDQSRFRVLGKEEYWPYLINGTLYVMNADGHTERARYDNNLNLEKTIQDDIDAGRSVVGIWCEERIIPVRESILTEIRTQIGKRKDLSPDLRKLINQENYLEYRELQQEEFERE